MCLLSSKDNEVPSVANQLAAEHREVDKLPPDMSKNEPSNNSFINDEYEKDVSTGYAVVDTDNVSTT